MNLHISNCLNWHQIISSSDSFFWFGCQIWHFLICVFVLWYFVIDLNLKNCTFKICLRQNAKCKMTAQTWRKHNAFVKICNLEYILKSNHRFFSSDPFCVFSLSRSLSLSLSLSLFLINSFYRRYVSCMYNKSNRSNRCNRLNTSTH